MFRGLRGLTSVEIGITQLQRTEVWNAFYSSPSGLSSKIPFPGRTEEGFDSFFFDKSLIHETA